MPYIKDAEKCVYQEALDMIEEEKIDTEGKLEYLICSLQDIFAAEREYRYKHLKRCVGCTKHAAHEFERRFLDNREEQAIAQNGEVFTRMNKKFGVGLWA